MKKFFFLIFCISFTTVYAQRNADSLAYQLQRKKINTMLAQRTQKFGQYNESLSKHTGIFGLQTKKDIRRSNDILMDIVKTDNDIYKELKILLDYRAFQQTQVQSRSREAEAGTLGYMTTINKLRAQIDKLKAESEKQGADNGKVRNILMVIIITLSAIIFLTIVVRKRKHAPARNRRGARKTKRRT